MENQDSKPSLTSPLIHACEENEERSNEKWFNREEVVEEVKRQLWLAGPLICASILQFSMQLWLVGLVLILIRNFWGYAYTNETEVVDYLATMMPVLATFNLLDDLLCVLSGTARGCGWQKIGAYVNLGSYYLVGIPLAVLMACFLHAGGKGLWLGMICALVVQVLSLLTITIRTNWEKEAKQATERVYEPTVPVDIVS